MMPRLDLYEAAVGVGVVPVPHDRRMPVHVAEERLLARVDHLHRPPGAQRQQADLHLHAQVLAGAEGAPDAGEVQPHLVERQAEAGRDLVLVDVQPLGGDVQVDAAVVRRDREAGLRAHEGLVLHAGLVAALDDDGARGVRSRPGGSSGGSRTLPRGWIGAASSRDSGSTSGSRRLVVDDDGRGGAPGGLGVVGGHRRDRLSHVADHVPGEDGLVGVVETVGLATGHVVGGEHRRDAGDLQRAGDVDAADRGGGMRRAHEVSPEHALGEQVGGEGELPADLRYAVGPRRRSRRAGRGVPPTDRAHPWRASWAARTAARIRP